MTMCDVCLCTYVILSDGPYSMLSWSLFANLSVKPVIYKWHKMHSHYLILKLLLSIYKRKPVQTEMGSSPVLHPEIWCAPPSLGSFRLQLPGYHCWHRGSGVGRWILGFLMKNIEYEKLESERITHSVSFSLNVSLSWLYKRSKALTSTGSEVKKSCHSAIFGELRICTVAHVVWVLHWRGQSFRWQHVAIHIDSLQVNSRLIYTRYWPRGEAQYLSQTYVLQKG